jgi:hypothetical protein
MRIRLLEGGPYDGLEIEVGQLPVVWEMPAAPPSPLLQESAQRYVRVGWIPGVKNAVQYLTPRQNEELHERPGGRSQAYHGKGAAVMYVREDQLGLVRKVE